MSFALHRLLWGWGTEELGGPLCLVQPGACSVESGDLATTAVRKEAGAAVISRGRVGRAFKEANDSGTLQVWAFLGNGREALTSSHEATTAPGGWATGLALSTGDKHSGEGARPSLGVYQAISEDEWLLPGS